MPLTKLEVLDFSGKGAGEDLGIGISGLEMAVHLLALSLACGRRGGKDVHRLALTGLNRKPSFPKETKRED